MDVAAFERVYESFGEFHAFFAVGLRPQAVAGTQPALSPSTAGPSPRSVATPRICRRPFRLRPGPCSAFSPRPAGMTMRS